MLVQSKASLANSSPDHLYTTSFPSEMDFQPKETQDPNALPSI